MTSDSPKTPDWISREIIFPASEAEHRAVRRAQRKLRMVPTGLMDEATRAAIRGVQRLFRLEPTGTLDIPTARVIDALRPQGEADEPEPEGSQEHRDGD